MTTKKFQRKREQGQTMAEFSLILPVLALLLFGVIQFGIVFNNYLAVTDAVRAGARQAAVSRYLPADEREDTVKQTVRDAADHLNTDPDTLVIEVVPSDDWEAGSDVTVTASYPYSINVLGKVVADGELTSETTERVE